MITKSTRGFFSTKELLSDDEQERVEDAIPALLAAFGKPHEHLGLRKIGPRLYEYRVGLRLRIVFRHRSNALYLLLVGTHNEVCRFVRSL